MKATPGQQAALQQVNALLVKCGLAATERNSGFECFLGSGSQRPYGSDEQELRVDLSAHRKAYSIVDSSSLAFLFTAVELEGEAQITRVVLSRNQRTLDLEKLRAMRTFKDFLKVELPAPLVEIEALLVKLAEVTDGRLKELEVGVDLASRIGLLNLFWASSSNRLMHREQMDAGQGPIDWLRAGVDIEHILYAWSSEGWNYTRAEPSLPLADATSLKGIPLHRIRALYPQVTGRS